MPELPYILSFDQIGIEHIELVGGKNASLGEMIRELKSKKIAIPEGFAITAHAYKTVLKENGALEKLKKILHNLDSSNTEQLQKAGKEARKLILNCTLPARIEAEILSFYARLSKRYHLKSADVAVRSSATAEDLPTASFAGQQETYLNVVGDKALLQACKRCFASLFTNRAIAYRCEHRIDHFKTSLSIGVQKMIRSDLGSAGVIFTLDTESGFPNVVFVTGSYGLGESIVQGAVSPDEFYVFKPTLKSGFAPIIQKTLGSKTTQIVYDGKQGIKTIKTAQAAQRQFCLSDKEVLTLARWSVAIEDHYSKKNKRWTPMDIEWGKDGRTGKLYILQARPETVQSKKSIDLIEEYRLKAHGKILTTGTSVGSKIGQGTAHIINDLKDMHKFQPGQVLVTEKTDPNWVPIMRIASAIVTNQGGRTSHAAIVSRELGLPCIVGALDATHRINQGQKVTIDCSNGEKGVVYEGLLKYTVHKTHLGKLPPLKTKLLVNVGNPGEAFKLSFLPVDGVGLAREEFIINDYIRIHPMALIHFNNLKDKAVRKQIQTLTEGYLDKKQFFIDKLAMGVALIAAAFYPREVILRFSDFKTNEYSHLIGGETFEPKEENPMIGWRGASRYYNRGYQEGFALECQAIKKVREEFGLTNLHLMIPVCRTPQEGVKVLKVMKEQGLARGKNGLKVLVMCEIPSNVILAEEFCALFDGFSIGSNDLTQMVLGVDRDSALVSDIYDERHPAVKKMVAHVIAVAKKHRCKIGICGDAPSTYPEFAKFLVDCSIDSISLTPDAILPVRKLLSRYEKLKKK